VFVDEDSARRFGLKPFSREQRAAMLEKAIARLGAMQAPSGGFSLWGNVSEYEYWLSAYVTHFLLDAREQGFNVPAQMQQKATDFLLRALQEGVSGLPTGKPSYNADAIWQDRRYAGSGRFGVLAYGAYVLARESKAPLATLRQLYELRAQAHSGLALVQLGIALKLMGDDARATTAIAEGIAKPRDGGPGGATTAARCATRRCRTRCCSATRSTPPAAPAWSPSPPPSSRRTPGPAPRRSSPSSSSAASSAAATRAPPGRPKSATASPPA
jgi:uncharacterized protein YfaS (alpha-2-macroglobulin family)